MTLIMPYLNTKIKKRLERTMSPWTAGELNFCFITLCQRYLAITDKRYEHFNTVLGALEAAKMEIYRRVIAAYEDKKIKENGDVFN